MHHVIYRVTFKTIFKYNLNSHLNLSPAFLQPLRLSDHTQSENPDTRMDKTQNSAAGAGLERGPSGGGGNLGRTFTEVSSK